MSTTPARVRLTSEFGATLELPLESIISDLAKSLGLSEGYVRSTILDHPQRVGGVTFTAVNQDGEVTHTHSAASLSDNPTCGHCLAIAEAEAVLALARLGAKLDSVNAALDAIGVPPAR